MIKGRDTLYNVHLQEDGMSWEYLVKASHSFFAIEKVVDLRGKKGLGHYPAQLWSVGLVEFEDGVAGI